MWSRLDLSLTYLKYFFKFHHKCSMFCVFMFRGSTTFSLCLIFLMGNLWPKLEIVLEADPV